MTEEKKTEEAEERSVYLGNSVPKVLRWIYAAFLAWMVVYLAKYMVPDLIQWLKR